MLSTTHLSRAILPPSKKASPSGAGTGSTLLLSLTPHSAGLSIGKDEVRTSPHPPRGHVSFSVTQYPSSPS